MNCPKCGQQYKCSCKTCKGKGWKWKKNDLIKCLKCGFEESADWWFELELSIYKKELNKKL